MLALGPLPPRAFGCVLLGATLIACAAPARPAAGPAAPDGAQAAAPASQAAAPAAPAAAPAAPAAPTAPPEHTTLLVSTTSSVFLPHKLAQVNGFFLAQGLDTEVIVTSSNVEAAAVATGEVDFSGQLPAAIRQRIAGLPMLGTAAVVGHSTRQLLAPPPYATIDDLRGKTLTGSSPAGTDTQVLRRVLTFYGLDPDNDVTILNAGDVPARWAAIQSGHAVGGLFAGGDVVKAQELGMRTIAKAADMIDMPENGLAVSERKFAEQPEQIKRAQRALLDSVTLIRTDPAEAARVLGDWIGVDERQARAQIDALVPFLSPDLTVSDTALQTVIDSERAAAGVEREYTPADVTNFSLLYEVLRERGLRQ
ncbi:MAG TPA: ABC transporter substrate-binding protein [Chloroflexota bacterium]|jgi:ABC-type nitrate/sulfonate/bicarbonate transport system substrate-binding protein